jgi:hypothetical protein
MFAGIDKSGDDEEIEPLAFTKVHAPIPGLDFPIAGLSAITETYRAEPIQNLEDYDPEQVEADRAIQPIKKLRSGGIYRDALVATPAPEPPARGSSFTRSEADTVPTPAPKEDAVVRAVREWADEFLRRTGVTPPPTANTLTYKLRQDDDREIWRESYNADGSLHGALILMEPEEIEKARLELLKDQINNKLQFRHLVR